MLIFSKQIWSIPFAGKFEKCTVIGVCSLSPMTFLVKKLDGDEVKLTIPDFQDAVYLGSNTFERPDCLLSHPLPTEGYYQKEA